MDTGFRVKIQSVSSGPCRLETVLLLTESEDPNPKHYKPKP